jgi:cytochrome P450
VAENPAACYKQLRETTPLCWSERYGGFWVTTKHDHVTTALGDSEHFSSARRDDAGGPGSSVSIPKRPSRVQYPLELDPPQSTPYRKILNPLLSPAASERLRAGVHDRVQWCIDQFIERGSCDLVAELTSAVPSSVTADWLGLEHDIWPMLATMMHDISSRAQTDPLWAEAAANMQHMYGAIEKAVAARRAEPKDDVISVVVHSEVDGEPMSDEAAVSVIALLVAGLRLFSPAQALARTMTGEAELGGCPIRDGDRVLIGFGSANRDADAFDDPDVAILDRFPNRHVAFGMGIHRCVGSNLARVIYDEVVRGVLTRIPDFQVDTEHLEHYHSQGLMSGWKTVPATFTPGERVGAPLDLHSFAVTR